jgi:dTMP kinase
MDGVFIVLDGIDGCGKSTQINLLKKALAAKGLPVNVSRWQDSAYIEKLYIGDLLKKFQTGTVVIPPEARTFLLAADISNRLESMIKPMLADGSIVVGDRYIYKIIAQGIARGLDKRWLASLFSFAIEPDLKILLDVPAATAAERITGYREISFYEAGLDIIRGADPKTAFVRFQSEVRKEILALMKEERGIIVNGESTIEEQHAAILGYVDEAIRAKSARSAGS